MSAPARIKQDDVTRVMRGARNAGFTRVRVTIDVQGNIMVDASDDPSPIAPERQNPLDRLLPHR